MKRRRNILEYLLWWRWIWVWKNYVEWCFVLLREEEKTEDDVWACSFKRKYNNLLDIVWIGSDSEKKVEYQFLNCIVKSATIYLHITAFSVTPFFFLFLSIFLSLPLGSDIPRRYWGTLEISSGWCTFHSHQLVFSLHLQPSSEYFIHELQSKFEFKV